MLSYQFFSINLLTAVKGGGRDSTYGKPILLLEKRLATTAYLIAILRLLVSSKEPKRLIEISRELGISASTAFRIMSSLKNAEWVFQDPITKKYSIGSGLQELAVSLVSQLDLRNASQPYLEMLYREVNENVMLTTRVGLERMYIEQIQCDHELRQVVEVGKRMPLWAGAPGKAILAYMEEEEIKAVMKELKKSGVRVLASGQVVDIDKLRQELGEIRQQGYSLTSGERTAGLHAVAAPIFGGDRRVLGAISTGGPEARFTMDMAIRYGPLLSEIGEKISLRLGRQFT